MSQCSVILDALRQCRQMGPENGLTAYEFHRLTKRYGKASLAAHSRIAELRGRGHKISCNKFYGVDRYYLEYDAELDAPKVNYSPELKAAGF